MQNALHMQDALLMQNALHVKTKVLAGNRIEIEVPGFNEGDLLDVFLVQCEAPEQPRTSMLEFIESLPPGPLLFKTPEEVDQYLQEERNSWDR